MSATCGPPSRTPLAFYDPDGCCWRTSQGTFPWDLTPSSPILPRWGMTRRGALYELLTPALPTTALASSSLLPTPNASVSQDGEHPETWEVRRQVALAKGYNGNGIGMPLTIAVQLLPTPVADHSRGLPQPGTDFQSLPNVVVSLLLPTPTVGDSKSARNSTATRHKIPPTGIHAGDTLTDAVTLMATPRVSASRTSRSAATRRDSMSAPSLEQCAEIARGDLPREFTTWEELPPSWRGGSTNPPSAAGNASPDGQPLDQLSLDEPETA